MQELFAQAGSLLEVRMVRDHFSGAPRGFAFAHFHTVGDAAQALSALQVSQLPTVLGSVPESVARMGQ